MYLDILSSYHCYIFNFQCLKSLIDYNYLYNTHWGLAIAYVTLSVTLLMQGKYCVEKDRSTIQVWFEEHCKYWYEVVERLWLKANVWCFCPFPCGVSLPVPPASAKKKKKKTGWEGCILHCSQQPQLLVCQQLWDKAINSDWWWWKK